MATSESRAVAPSRSPRRGSRRPDFRRRQMIAAGAGLVLVIAGLVWGWRLIAGDEDRTPELRVGWNAVLAVTRDTGEIDLLDQAGQAITNREGDGPTTALHVDRDRFALVGPTGIRLGRTTDTVTRTVDLPEGWTVTRHPDRRGLLLWAAPAGPGNLILVDGRDGATIDLAAVTGERAPLYFPESLRADPSLQVFALGDGRNFQTVVAGFALTEPTFFPGVPVAVGADLVITATTVGRSSEIGIFSIAGERLNTAPSARPVAGLLRSDRFVYVTTAGTVHTIGTRSGKPSTVGELVIPAGDEILWAHPADGHTRLVVAGRRFLTVLDDSGTVISTLTFTSERRMNPPGPTDRCLPVGDTAAVHSLVDLRTGTTLVDLRRTDGSEPSLLGVAPNGCGVHVTGSLGAEEMVLPGGRFVLSTSIRRVVMAPEADAAILVDFEGVARLWRFEGTMDEPRHGLEAVPLDGLGARTELGVRRGLIDFATR